MALKAGEEEVDSVILSDENEWSGSIDKLPVYAAGEKIEYSWDEGTITGYTLTGSVEDAGLTTLTNMMMVMQENSTMIIAFSILSYHGVFFKCDHSLMPGGAAS